jgi:hypothetical protein
LESGVGSAGGAIFWPEGIPLIVGWWPDLGINYYQFDAIKILIHSGPQAQKFQSCFFPAWHGSSKVDILAGSTKG